MNLDIKKHIPNLKIRLFPALILLLSLSGCSFFYENKNSSKEKYNIINKEIIKNYSKAITKNPNNFLFYIERGKAKHDYGDFKGAINDFNYSLKIKPDPIVIFYRANSKFDYGDYEGAMKDYENLIVNQELKDRVFYNIASIQLLNFKYLESIDNYTKSLDQDREDQYAFLNRGNAKFIKRNYSGSIEDYSNSIAINNKSYVTFNNRGVSKFKLRLYRSALKDFKKSLKLNPYNYNTFYNKSLTHLKLKEIKKACINLKKSIKLGKEVFEDEYSEICI